MARVAKSITLPAAAAQVWQLIGNFGGADRWLPGAVGCTLAGQGVGAVRTVSYTDGSRIEERLEQLDEAGRSLSYLTLTATPFQDCLHTMAVADLGGEQSIFVWSCHFTARGLPEPEAEALMAGAIGQACAALQKRFA